MSPSAQLFAALVLAGLASASSRADQSTATPSPATPAPAPSLTAPAPLPDKVLRFEQMLVRSPGPGRSFDEVFSHYFSTEGVAALRDRWTAARDAAPAGPARAARAAYGLLLGQLAERIGDANTARARYAEAASADPKDFRPLHRLGRLEIREGKLPAGLAALEKAAALDLPPADAQDVLRDLARARSRGFDEAGSLAAWKSLADRFPDDALVLEEVGQAQLDASAFDAAVVTFTALEKAAGADPYRAVLARLRLGEVAARQGDRDAALARFSAALDGTHRDSWLHREARARVDALFRDRGDFDGLVAFQEARLAGASRDPADAVRLANLLIELDRTDAALGWFEKAVTWSPDDHALRFAQIRALIAAKRPDDALARLTELVKRQPKEAAYREALGQLHWDRSKADTAAPAVAASERKLALDTWAALAPADASVTQLLALAEIYRSHRLDEETRVTLARAFIAEPASYDLRERLVLQLLSMKLDTEAWHLARGEDKGLADAAQYRRLAVLEKRNGLLDESLVSIDRGLALSSDNYELLDLRWQVLSELKRWDDAVALFPKLLARVPGDFALDALETRHVQALRSAEKSDAALAALSARVTADDPALTESDVRLRLRLLLTQAEPGLPADLDAAFADARQRFPASFSLALIEADYRERTSALADRVAALRRLVVLRPERSSEWLRRLINTYRYEGDLDNARKVVGELIALAPADAQNHVLASDLEFDAGKPDDGIAALQRALRLASDPAPVRSRLARAQLEQNRPAAALSLYEEAYYSAASDTARRALLPSITEAAVIASDLDGLVTRYTERNRTRRDSADYHLDIGEIYFNASDFPRAQESWNRALEIKRDNPRLLERLIELARRNSDPVEVLRLVRLRQEIAPSPANAVALAESLLETDSAPEAVELFTAHAAYFYTDTTLLPRILPPLSARGLAEPLIERLRAESAAAADPADRDFVLATAFISIADFARAEKLLWDVYNRPPAPVPSTPATPPAPVSQPSIGGTPTYTPEQLAQMAAYQSIQETSNAYQTTIQLLQNQSSGGGRYYGGRSRMFYGGGMPAQPNPTKTQDTALGYLAALAVQQNQAAAFVTKLEAVLEARRLPASARLLEFAKVQAREAGLRQFDAALAEPSPSMPALQIASQQFLNAHDPQTGQQLPRTPADEARFKALNELVSKNAPPLTPYQQRMKELSELQQKQDFAGALAKVKEIEALPSLSANERRQLVHMRVYLRTQAKQWDDFIPFMKELVADEPQFAGDQVLWLFGTYLGRDDGKAATSPAEWSDLAGILLDAYAKPIPAALAAQYQSIRHHRSFGRSSGSSAAHQNLQELLTQGAPFGNALPGMQYQLKQVFGSIGKNREPFLAAILAAGAQRDEAGRLLARTLTLRFAFACDDSKLAESLGAEFLAANPDPNLVFNLAELAFRENRLDAAKARYAAIPISTGTLALAAQCRLLEIALAADDTETAKAAATRIVNLRPPSYLPNINLSETLRELGLDKTLKPAATARATPPRASVKRRDRNEEIQKLVNEIDNALNKNDYAAAEPLARRMLSLSPLADARQGNNWGRTRALNAFTRAGLMDAYIADLDAQLARSPNSPTVLELLAEAHGNIRQQGRNSGTPLPPVAASPAPVQLPVRLRLVREGDAFTASYASVLFSAADHADPASPGATAAASGDTAFGHTGDWTTLGSVTLPDIPKPRLGLTGRNQNFRNFADGRFTDIQLGKRTLSPAEFPRRETATVDGKSAVILPLAGPFIDGSTLELTLDDTPAPKSKLPSNRGLVLRDAEGNPALLTFLRRDDGTLALAARRNTGDREFTYLAALIALRPRDEQLRTRYVEALFSARRSEEAVAFVTRLENQDLLPRFASNGEILGYYRKAGRLPEFATLVADRAVAKAAASQYPQIDYNVLQFANQLRDAGDTAAAILIWEKILPSMRDNQSGEVAASLARALLSLGTPEARARAITVIRGQFIPAPKPVVPPAPIFGSYQNRYYQQPWYANFGSNGSRIQSGAFVQLDTLDDTAFLRDLLADNAPRLAAADAGWEPRCFDLALKIRLGSPDAIPTFVAFWDLALADAKKPAVALPGRPVPINPIGNFLPASLDRLSSWPDPARRLDPVFRSVIDQFPKTRGQPVYSGNTPFSQITQNPWMEFSLRFAWADAALARGDAAGYRQALLDLTAALALKDPNQINYQVITQLFDRLLSIGELAEARIVHDTILRRSQRQQGYASNDPRGKQPAAILDTLEGKGEPYAPLLAAWISPAADGTPELRWELTRGFEIDKNHQNGNEAKLPPRVFGTALPVLPAGTRDLVIEFVDGAAGKEQVLSTFTVPAVAARGSLRLSDQPAGHRFRAVLRAREGATGPDITLGTQVFSTRPNLLANPSARIQPPATPPSGLQIPGWNLPIPPLTYSGGPGGTVVRLTSPQGNNAERLTRTAPIPIDPKAAYVISAWTRVALNEYAQVGLEFFDADGKTLNQHQSQSFNGLDVRWRRLAFHLSSTSRPDLPNYQGIPSNAASLRVWIASQNGLELSDLAIQELPALPKP